MFSARSRVFTAGLLALCCTPVALAQPTGFDDFQLVRLDVQTPADVAYLQTLTLPDEDFRLWSEVVRPGPVDVLVSPAGQLQLPFSGLPYEVLIDDYQTHLDQLYSGEPDDFFSSLRSYSEHVQFLQSLADNYPQLAQLVTIGTSVEGREMLALRITGRGHARPAVFFHGAEHGNEQAPASVMAYIANHLLTNYGSDPAVTDLVDHVEWYLLPITNPDGYIRSRRYNAHNVDLNRNWDGPGSGQDPSGGPYPFSEPETAALRDFLLARPTIRVHVDLHGYVPWIMWPWAHTATPCPHDARFREAGVQMRGLISAAGGGTYSIGSVYHVAYPTSGCSNNYTYGVLDIWGFGIEVRDSTMPRICEQFLDAMVYLGDWIVGFDCNGNGIDDPLEIASGASTDLNGNGVPDECDGLGDANCDGFVDNEDIDPFVLALTDPAAYQQTWPLCDIALADINGDGLVDNEDIDPFVALVTTP